MQQNPSSFEEENMWNWKSYFSRVVLVLIPHLIAQLIPILKVYFITWENGFFYFFLSQENPAKYSGISIKQTPLVQKKVCFIEMSAL